MRFYDDAILHEANYFDLWDERDDDPEAVTTILVYCIHCRRYIEDCACGQSIDADDLPF